ncbi:unnamed protein product [Cyprideis torosa]|uniref:Uncharacterized protein n=1 Tax=Cyprideis torosa TaxID=163714 RepID=A0A7R8W285_9CRUS|nr:unnamed protein product [Cyprideis torosa]CAG0881709.1 unnamed protein product [Cyprideis torosa]
MCIPFLFFRQVTEQKSELMLNAKTRPSPNLEQGLSISVEGIAVKGSHD